MCVVIGLVLITQSVNAQPKEQSSREAMYYRYLEFPSYVKGGTVQPHWMADGSSFWYAEGGPGSCTAPNMHGIILGRVRSSELPWSEP